MITDDQSLHAALQMMRQRSADTTVLYSFPDGVLDSSDSPDDHEARGRKRRADEDEDEDEDQGSENDTSKPVLKRGTSRASKRQRLNAYKVAVTVVV